MFRWLFIFFICCHISYAYAQQNKSGVDSTFTDTGQSEDKFSEEDIIITDTTLFKHTIVLPIDTITQWKMNRKFAYVKNLDSLLKAKQQEELSAYKKNSNDGSSAFLIRLLSSGFLRILFWAIAVSFVFFILYRLFIINGIFRKTPSSNIIKEISEEQRVIEPSDYDALVHQSFKLGDYRMAVRYLFLKTLRQLSDSGLVKHSGEKTNYQYCTEIPDIKKKEFASLVLNYEYVWYGHINISREQYENIEKGYTSFFNKI